MVAVWACGVRKGHIAAAAADATNGRRVEPVLGIGLLFLPGKWKNGGDVVGASSSHCRLAAVVPLAARVAEEKLAETIEFALHRRAMIANPVLKSAKAGAFNAAGAHAAQLLGVH